ERIEKQEKRGRLSYAQQRLWFLDQLEPGNAAYNIPVAVRLLRRVEGGVLQRALRQVVEGPEVMRSGCGGEGGKTRQVGGVERRVGDSGFARGGRRETGRRGEEAGAGRSGAAV